MVQNVQLRPSLLCPHCKSELNQGATACAHCGAYETQVVTSGGGAAILKELAVILAVVLVVSPWLGAAACILGVIVFVVIALMTEARVKKKTMKTMWLLRR